VLTENKLDDIGARLEISPRKSLKTTSSGDERFENLHGKSQNC